MYLVSHVYNAIACAEGERSLGRGNIFSAQHNLAYFDTVSGAVEEADAANAV